ncbi:MAG TPA: choice-of-anchor tandem repeat NxxGxxAF-containing protein [Phycisphaerae bacterium]|nr:choice-of-anchor tandem repeat NxxGxxAF-containing protein [Phycisphaerae bacterium]
MRIIRPIIVALAGVTTCVMNTALAGGGLSFQAVSLSGQAAPGIPGRFFSYYYPPVISNSGRVAFAGWLTGVTSNDQGLWSGLPGSIQLVAREGSAAPGTTGVFTGNGWLFPWVNSSGIVAFSAALTGAGIDSTNNTGIWVGAPGAIAPAARAGNGAPGTPAGVVFSGGMQNWLMLNDAGQIVFRANLTGPGVDSSNDAGIWAGAPGALQLVAREGDTAPGTGGVFDLFNYQFEAYPLPVMNAAGEVVFAGHCTSGRGIWRWSGGVLELLALTNTAAPGTGVLFEYLYDPWMNASGQVAFGASLMGDGVDFMNNRGVWSGAPGAVELVVRKGSAAPGAVGRYLTLNGTNVGLISIQDDGAITLISGLMYSDGSIAPGTGLWRYGGGGGGSAMVIPETPATGLSGATIGSVSFFGPHPSASMPFMTYLSGTGVNGGNDESLWLKDAGSSPLLIVREGDLFDVGGGDMRAISGGYIHASLNGGQGRCYNSNRQMVIGLTFEGGTTGVFTANVPVQPKTGDMNCDGKVDGLDVDGFAQAMLDPSGYAAEHPSCNALNGDINLDSLTDPADTEQFVSCVLNGGCP